MFLPYPVQFIPYCLEKIWGGTGLRSWGRGSEIQKAIGETWEVSDQSGKESVVINGVLQGWTLSRVMAELGREWFPNIQSNLPFPLLIKLIDAQDTLSIQVHPDDQTAQMIHQDPWGKTEMWYILQVQKNAKIYCGFDKKFSLQKIKEALNEAQDISPFLQCFYPKKGDVFFVPAGTVHAVGAGCVLLEVQRNSDRTYRISDWGRTDEQGKSRALHIKEALRALSNQDHSFYKSNLITQNGCLDLVDCPWFKVQKYNYSTLENQSYLLPEKDGMVFVLSGEGLVGSPGQQHLPMKLGDLFLLPYDEKCWSIMAKNIEFIYITGYGNQKIR